MLRTLKTNGRARKTLQIFSLLTLLNTLRSFAAENEEVAPQVLHLSDQAIITEPSNNLSMNTDQAPTPPTPARLQPFTGKVTGSKVRLRLQPNRESPIIKELNQGDLWVVAGEIDDFYAVEPKQDMKGYVFRTYVLDNHIEGTNVNLRLRPDTEAPIITQLHQGDTLLGRICPDQQKWYEIELPKEVRFYIAKEYMKNIGNKDLYQKMEQDRLALHSRLVKVEQNIDREFQKSFHDIQPAPLAHELKEITLEAKMFPEIKDEAEATLSKMQDEYLNRSILAQAQSVETLSLPEKGNSPKETPKPSLITVSIPGVSCPLKAQEESLVKGAIAIGAVENEGDFYQQQRQKTKPLKGVLVPYERQVQNRPGDFIFVDSTTKMPLAYVYSNHIDLKNYTSNQVTIFVIERPNHNFALPAYYVLELTE